MGKIAFIFSGQGAQYSGMGKELYEASPAAKAVYDMADSVREGTSKQCFEGSTEELCKTVNTQPCVFTADLAAAYALVEKGIKPDCVAGFSLGEIAALAFSKMLSDEEAFKLVCKRGELMDKAGNQLVAGAGVERSVLLRSKLLVDCDAEGAELAMKGRPMQ